MQNIYVQYSAIFKSLGDETRLKIISMLIEKEDLCACHLLENFTITQPTLSYHMKMLTESGIVIAEKNGQWMHYRINKENMDSIKEFLNKGY